MENSNSGYWKIQNDSEETASKKTENNSEIDSIMSYYSAKSRLSQTLPDNLSEASSHTIQGSSSHVGAFVESVSGESLRYTAKDMEVIRKESRISEEKARDELKTMEMICRKYESLMVELQKKHEKDSEKLRASYSRALTEKAAVQTELDAVDKQVFELHARFGKLRGIVENVKRNEQTLRNTVADHEQRLLEEQERFRQLKDWSQKFVNQANETIADTEASVNHRLLALETENRRLKIKQESIAAELERKTEEVKELTGICDELITSASANY